MNCFLNLTSRANVSIKVSPHSSLNTSQGVIRCGDLEGVRDEKVFENLSSQDVTAITTRNWFPWIPLF